MKLIAIDLDGTLLNNEGRISKRTAEVISKVQQAGHKVVIATGRHTAAAMPIAQALTLTDAVVSFNGALVTNLQSNQVELAHSYIHNDIQKLTDQVKKWGVGYIASTKYSYHIEPQFRQLINFYTSMGARVEEIKKFEKIGLPILKTSIVGEEEQLNEIERFVQPSIPHLHVVRSGEQSIDVMSPKANKGEALQWLANYYQVKQEDTIALGNYYNDVSMFSYAGISVAVENAPEPVKQHADIITQSNEENGVAKFLEEHILGNIYSHA